MTTTNRLVICLALSCALLAPLSRADAPRRLMWADLVPTSAAMDNPFTKLTREQLSGISDVAAVRDRKARGDKTLSASELANEQALSHKLGESGIDVDALLAMRKEIAERGQTVNATLDGQVVRLPGYLLPIEFSGKLVTEFLLVPWVGACIHTPPPPPNQIVHVKPDKPFPLTGMFAPVWVTGQMATTSAKKSLSFMDGSADIDIGYSLRASLVEPYKE